MIEGDYVHGPRWVYEFHPEIGTACFVRVCEKCGRFVKANDSIRVNLFEGGLIDEPNAICSKCGPTKMLFEGFF